MHQYRVSARGVVTIPREVREDLGLRPGSRAAFEMRPEGLAIVPVAAGEAERTPPGKGKGRADGL